MPATQPDVTGYESHDAGEQEFLFEMLAWLCIPPFLLYLEYFTHIFPAIVQVSASGSFTELGFPTTQHKTKIASGRRLHSRRDIISTTKHFMYSGERAFVNEWPATLGFLIFQNVSFLSIRFSGHNKHETR